jgi:hypothetical protein
MERTKSNTVQNAEEGKVRWKKAGGGSFRMGNKIIKPGETFWAFPGEIPKAFRDVVIPLNGDVVFKEEKKKEELTKNIEGKKPAFIAKQREGEQWWDVFNVQIVDGKEVEKKFNEKGLTEEKANSMLEDLLK